MSPVYGPGAKDTGKGAGMEGPGPGFPTWKASSALPNGLVKVPDDFWAHGGYFFLADGSTLYRFAIDAAGNLTPDGSVTTAGMGLVGPVWNACQCAWYDADGSVILLTRPTSGTSQTPVLGKWLCSNWPFTAANAEWLSPLKAHWGTFKNGEIVGHAIGLLNTTTDKLYLSSLNCGQVARVDTTDGSVDGFWEPWPYYTPYYPVNLHGFDSADRPFAGGYQAAQGDKHSHSWDDSNPASWSTVAQLLTASYVNGAGQPLWNRAMGNNHGTRNRTFPLTPHELSILGLDDRAAWWVSQRYAIYGEYMLVTFVPVVNGEYQNRTIAHAAERRATPNAIMSFLARRFMNIDSYPWLVGYNLSTLDQEAEDPGGNVTYHRGLCLTPIGPVGVTWSGAAPAAGVPKQMTIEIDPAAVDYLHSASYGKHRFRMRVTPIATGIPGPWSDWRSGKRQLDNVGVVVDGKDVWPSFVIGDTVRIDQQMCAGWPYQWDAVSGNPGEVGDPSTPPIGTADVAPPREVLPILHYEPAELGGGLL
jgi:hypothetical protein